MDPILITLLCSEDETKESIESQNLVVLVEFRQDLLCGAVGVFVEANPPINEANSQIFSLKRFVEDNDVGMSIMVCFIYRWKCSFV